MATIDEEFVATAGGVGPGLGTMKHNGTVVDGSRLDPGGHAKRMAPAEVADRCGHGMVAGEVNGLAIATGNESVFARGGCGSVCWWLWLCLLAFGLFCCGLSFCWLWWRVGQ